jgi:DNA-binding response OmpR family regulator
MTQSCPPHPRRALIIEDEFFVANDLEEMMHTLGFDICDLAPNVNSARSLAMSDQPDIVLVDVCLEGGREGIEIARWLREVCAVPVVFVTSYTDQSTIDHIRERVPGAPILSKSAYPESLAGAVGAVDPGIRTAPPGPVG